MSKFTAIPALVFWRLIPGVKFLPQIVTGSGNPDASTGYRQWADANGVGGPTEDGDNDGICNLVEYAFGSDPKKVTYRGIAPLIGTDDAAGRFWIEARLHVTDDPLLKLAFEIGDGNSWQPATFSDLDKTKGLTWEPIADEADFANAINGVNSVQVFGNHNKGPSPLGLIRAIVTYDAP